MKKSNNKIIDEIIRKELLELQEIEDRNEKKAKIGYIQDLIETKNKNTKKKNNNKNETFKNIVSLLGVGVTAMGIVIPLFAYDKWYREGLKFEEEGSYSSLMVRNLISSKKPVK